MGLLKIIKKTKEREKEMRLLILGLDNAGKTTILKKFNGEDISQISPTLGFNIKTLQYKQYKLNVWDVGGQTTIRTYWRNYFEQTDGVIWVVDSTDKARLDDCKRELVNILKQEKLIGATLLIFCNKQDVPKALSLQQIREYLELDLIETRHWGVIACSAVTGQGLIEGIDWIVSDIASRIFMMTHCDWYHNAKAVSITGSNYDSLVGADKYVVLDFFTPWCIYCQQMLGEYNRVYDYYLENRPDILIAKINCDEQQNQVICRSLGVGSFPTILFFNPESKQPISQFQNYRKYDLFLNWIDQLAKKSQQQIEKEEQLKAEKLRLQELAKIEEEERRRQFEMQEQLKQDMDKQIDSHKFEIKSYEEQFRELQETIDSLQSKVAQLNTDLALLKKKPKININQVLVFGIFGFLIGITLTSCICLTQRKQHHN